MKIRFLSLAIFVSLVATGQKPPLNPSVYDGWESIGSQIVSDDGKWISYQINPQEGDGWLYFYNVASGKIDSVARGTKAAFSPECEYVVYQILPPFSETREAKKKKLKEDKLPKSDLEVRRLASSETIKVSRVKSFAVPEEKSFWMAYLKEKATEKKDTAQKPDPVKPDTSSKSKSVKKPPEPKGTELVIWNPVNKKEFRFMDVTEYSVARDGKTISFLQEIPDSSKTSAVNIKLFDTRSEIVISLFEDKGTIKKLTLDKTGDMVSFLFSSDTSKVKIFTLWLSRQSAKAVKIIDTVNKALPSGWSVSENGALTFSEDATRLYFGSAKKPVKEPEDTLTEDEKYKLDIWSWNDDIIQPMQKKQLDQEIKRSYLAVYHIDKGIVFQLADTVVPVVRTIQKGTADLILASTDLKYRRSSSWDNSSYADHYIINAETGSRRLILENSPSELYLSPAGNYLLIYDYSTRAWHSMAVQSGEKKVLITSDKFPLYNELNDVPSEPQPYGMAGWIDDNRHVIVYDRYDLWYLDLSGVESPQCVSDQFGRNNDLRLRYIKLDPETEFINKKDKLLLSAFNYENKEAGFYSLTLNKPVDPVKIIMERAAFSRGVTKAEDANTLVFQKESSSTSPELYVSDITLKSVKRITGTNPQQKNFNWITTELVEWTSFDNSKLQGILYKPENFNPSLKYPMIVYFYERSSDGLYSYFPPAPSASIINRTFATSNGYLVFVPDIPYKTGYPGQSCYDAVVSGTYALLDRYDFIDRNRLGLDGQSWGGYQIAWLVTRTDLYACAYAGAPVSNMTSAYGGIRWESGMSRMFQYEKTQSRIGGTLWEKPVHYIENSPIFFVPKINTPLLLMHNDADGAVPWYQGIEFFVALRRLNKPAWLLSYNDEAHNLVRRANRKDISIRKMQFFDHYLKAAPMPYWMHYGIRQTEKGKTDGYGLVND